MGLQTALADLLDSQRRLELAFQSASASPVQGNDTDTAATVAAASVTQAAIQVGPSGVHAWLCQCMAQQPSMLHAEFLSAATQIVPCRCLAQPSAL